MGALLTYIIKSGICLALFYLFYRLLLSRETFHRFNRFALLGVLGLAVGLPFIRYTQTETVQQPDSVLQIETTTILSGAYLLPTEFPALTTDIPEQPDASVTPLIISLLLAIYMTGLFFFFLRTAWSFFKLFRLMHTGTPPIVENNIRIYIVPQEIAPFSWMNRVVVSQKDWQENRKEILAHETGHIRYRHSWDLLFTQLCTILHWFNPAVWLLKQELQNIHEFEADTYVLDKGIEAKQYQLLLIKKAVGSQRFTSMANSFNHSKLKKRIAMMLKSKSSPWARMKYLYILPLSILITTAFARPEIAEPLQKISDVKITEIFPEKKTPQEKTEAEETKSLEELKEQVETTLEVLSEELAEKVKDALEMAENLLQNSEERLAQKVADGLDEREKKIKEFAELITSEAQGNMEQAAAELDAMFQELNKQIEEGKTEIQTQQKLYIVDGKERSKEEFEKIEDIYSFTVLTKEEAAEQFGEDNKKTVVVAHTVSEDKPHAVIGGPIKDEKIFTSPGEVLKDMNGTKYKAVVRSDDGVSIIMTNGSKEFLLEKKTAVLAVENEDGKIESLELFEDVLIYVNGREMSMKGFDELKEKIIDNIEKVTYGPHGENMVTVNITSAVSLE